MKLHYSMGPNPNVVRMAIAEKGIAVEKQRVNLTEAENRREPYLRLNPLGQLPILELDDGTALSEITAICEYLDEVQPEPPLLGTTAVERALTRMWVRRLDLNIAEPMTKGYQYGDGLPVFQDRIRCIPEAAPALREIARHWLGWLDGDLGDRPFIAGERFTLADILLFCFTSFGSKIGQPLDPAWTHLQAWHARIAARPSTKG